MSVSVDSKMAALQDGNDKYWQKKLYQLEQLKKLILKDNESGWCQVESHNRIIKTERHLFHKQSCFSFVQKSKKVE